MFFGEGQDAPDVIGMRDGLLDIAKGEQLLADNATETFGDLLLALGEHTVEREAQYLFWAPGVEQELEGHPDREPVDKGGDEGDGIEPPGQFRHTFYYEKEANNLASFCYFLGGG